MAEQGNKKQGEIEFPIKFADFLMSTPPYTVKMINDLFSGGNISTPTLKLYCDSDECDGLRFFDFKDKTGYPEDDKWEPCFLEYYCRHCRKNRKVYSLWILKKGAYTSEVVKFGEWPLFGPHIPSRVISLIGPDRDLFLKGRRAETNGLGIGAFTYYRRVVVNQWKRLLDEIIRVREKLNLPTEILKQAKLETRFSKAVETVKDAVPQVLLIEGHNPITLLHDTLSKGIHNLSDDECLELAKSIRVILSDFAERLGQALKERTEIREALTKLFTSGSPNKSDVEAKEEKTNENTDRQ